MKFYHPLFPVSLTRTCPTIIKKKLYLDQTSMPWSSRSYYSTLWVGLVHNIAAVLLEMMPQPPLWAQLVGKVGATPTSAFQ